MPGFSFATTSSYTLTIECTDSVSTVTKTYTVNIDKNDSPTISNLHSKFQSCSKMGEKTTDVYYYFNYIQIRINVDS